MSKLALQFAHHKFNFALPVVYYSSISIIIQQSKKFLAVSTSR